MPATIRVSLLVRQDAGRKTVYRMWPDFRFVIGAALALAVLAVAAIGLLTAVRVTHQAKVGPFESSRSLVFDNRTDWNPFYDSDNARRFDALARKSEGAQPPPAGDGPAGTADPVEATAAVTPADRDEAAGERTAPAADAADASEVATPASAAAAPEPASALLTGDTAPAAPATDDPSVTGTLSATAPGADDAAKPTAESEPGDPPAAADRLANAPATPAVATPEQAPSPSAMPETSPAEAAAPARKATPRRARLGLQARERARARASKPRAVRATPKPARPQISQPLGTEQYERQQSTPQSQWQNDPFGQPVDSRPNLYRGG